MYIQVNIHPIYLAKSTYNSVRIDIDSLGRKPDLKRKRLQRIDRTCCLPRPTLLLVPKMRRDDATRGRRTSSTAGDEETLHASCILGQAPLVHRSSLTVPTFPPSRPRPHRPPRRKPPNPSRRSIPHSRDRQVDDRSASRIETDS